MAKAEAVEENVGILGANVEIPGAKVESRSPKPQLQTLHTARVVGELQAKVAHFGIGSW